LSYRHPSTGSDALFEELFVDASVELTIMGCFSESANASIAPP